MIEYILLSVLAFLNSIVPNILIFIALCATDVLLGVAASIKRGRFEWGKVADFYKKNVLAYLLGWFTFASFGAFVIDKINLLGENQYIASTAFVWGTWSFLAAALVASIGSNFKELYGRDLGPTAFHQEG